MPLGLAAWCAACPGSLDHPERFKEMQMQTQGCAAGIDVVRDLFPTRCTTGACHGNGALSQDGLDLVSPGLPHRIIGEHSVSCTGRTVVSTAAPEMSVLLDRISATPQCGSRMPLGLAPLSNAEIDCVHAWVLDIVRSSTAAMGM
jgi:hypothetical protein